ncbi:MAG: 3-methyl-2-oxobutanoate hydroxymethyltransferase, partial [Muribaculaceae bacterium]|nr:3-methyl-2-oxobutanoate hydroxymethyltransferase [Muribaculaceae bacterium]
IAPTIERIVSAGIPVMGHLGLTPQSINQLGTYGVQAKEDASAEKLIADALALQQAGCFAIVLEKIPATLATKVSKTLEIPTIGIGAGAGCDGQVLVVQDMLGMNKGFSPKFLRKYADLNEVMTGALQAYISDVKSGDFPSASEAY